MKSKCQGSDGYDCKNGKHIVQLGHGESVKLCDDCYGKWLNPTSIPNTQITERSSYHGGKGIARFFIPFDPTLYGYWVPEEHWESIVGKDIVKQMREHQETIEVQLDEEKIALVKKVGNNPYAK